MSELEVENKALKEKIKTIEKLVKELYNCKCKR